MLTILLGDYGSGKTRTARYLAKKTGGVYLNVDIFSQSNNKNDGSTFADRLITVMKPNTDYFMDGWPSHYYYGNLTSEILGVEVKYIVCMVAPEILRKRQVRKAKRGIAEIPRNIDGTMSVTHFAASIALTYDNNPLFADTTTSPPTFWNKQDWLTRWMELVLYSRLKDAKEYQDVELSDRTICGLSKSYKTWERLDTLVDFKGKSVLDYGCNYGYFCFKAEEAGAEAIIGIDESTSVLNLAASIAMTKNSRAKFIASELKDYNPPDTDIVMALNTLHHLNYDKKVLNSMFACAREVVLEMPSKDANIIDTVARPHHFGKPVIASSHRLGRCIIIYSKAKPIALPRKFEYRPRQAAIKRRLLRIAQLALHCFLICTAGIPAKIMRHFGWRLG